MSMRSLKHWRTPQVHGMRHRLKVLKNNKQRVVGRRKQQTELGSKAYLKVRQLSLVMNAIKLSKYRMCSRNSATVWNPKASCCRRFQACPRMYVSMRALWRQTRFVRWVLADKQRTASRDLDCLSERYQERCKPHDCVGLIPCWYCASNINRQWHENQWQASNVVFLRDFAVDSLNFS